MGGRFQTDYPSGNPSHHTGYPGQSLRPFCQPIGIVIGSSISVKYIFITMWNGKGTAYSFDIIN
jgi:hypothetical protein